jgi:acetyltransferase-like isoleucine patch superfamily enzyme
VSRFDDWQPPEIKDGVMTRWGWMVSHPENLTLGRNTDIGAFTYIGAHIGVEIGDNCQIGAHCAIYSLNTIDDKSGKVIIRKGACVGANSVVMPGVDIGENSIVGALSLVKSGTRIPANETWVGIPAKKVPRRPCGSNIGDVANADTVL